MITVTKTYDTVYANVDIAPDEDCDVSWLESDDYEGGKERLAAYNRGEWSMVGVIVTVYGCTDDMLSWEHDELASASLWGIESDSEPSYFRTVADELLTKLAPHLTAIGIDPSSIELTN